MQAQPVSVEDSVDEASSLPTGGDAGPAVRPGFWIALLVIVGGVLLLGYFAGKPVREAWRGPYDVIYSAQMPGGCTGDITYAIPGGQQQEKDVANPWRKNVTVSPGDFLYVSAQNGCDHGSVSVKIETETGKVLNRATSSGGYAIASTDAVAPQGTYVGN